MASGPPMMLSFHVYYMELQAPLQDLKWIVSIKIEKVPRGIQGEKSS